MVVCPESCPRSQSCALRLRPGKGLRCGRGLFRMAMFAWAEVTLLPRWKEPLREKRVGAALDWLRGQGVREAVLPDTWQALARSRHIAPISRERALEACAGQAVQEACRALGLPLSGIGLAVCGRAVSQTAAGELLSLARLVRTVRVCGEGNDGLRAQLWRSCGIVDRGPMPGDIPVVALRLRGGEAPRGALLTVDLTGAAAEGDERVWSPVLLPPEGALAQMPPGLAPDAFSAALFAAGAVRSREIHVSRLDIPECTQYNKETIISC